MLTKQEDTLSECRLTFEVSPELYQRIDTEALFNLKPQLRGPFSTGPFQPEPDIEFEELVDTGLAVTESAISEIFEEVTSAFEELTEAATEAYAPSATSKEEILPIIVNFFTYDDWPFAKIKGEPVLRMMFESKNGKWTCYAKARPEQAQFVFYSICPVNIPENKRLAIAEFIALANYGTIIGNFDLNFASGEIRYKTSIDVEGSTLTFPQIKQLVYTKVMMMDQYLPGIMSVIAGGMEVKDAIAQIES